MLVTSTKVCVRFKVGADMAMEVVVDVFPTEPLHQETAIARAALILARRIDYHDTAADVSFESAKDLGVGGTGWHVMPMPNPSTDTQSKD